MSSGRDAKAARNAFGDQLDAELRCPLRLLGLEQKEIACAVVVDDGHFAMIDAVGVGDDVGARFLAKDGLEAHDGGTAQGCARAPFTVAFYGSDDICQDVAGADAGQLVDVADQQEVGAEGDGLEQMVGEHHVEHRGLIHNDEICLERILLVALKRHAFGRLEFEQAVQRAGLAAGGLAQALGGAAGWGGQQHTAALAVAQAARRCARSWSYRCRGRRSARTAWW